MTRVGIIGSGWVAQDRHIPCFQAVPGVEVAAVYDRNPERARSVADRFGIPFVARNRDELLSHGLDAVSIATSPWSHAEHARAALECGLHVFCEKPMAMNRVEAQSMADAAIAAARTLTISHNFRFARSSRLATAAMGPHPELLLASAVQLSSDRRRLPVWYRDLPGGLLFDEVPHLLYTLQSWCGPLRIDDAAATWRSDGHPGVVQVRFAGRVPAQATMIFGAPQSEWHVTLVGRRKTVDLDLFRDIAVRLGPDGEHRAVDIGRTSAAAILEHAVGFVGSGVQMVRGRLHWGHDALIAGFIAAARGEGPNPVPVSEALGVVELADQLLDAIEADRHGAGRTGSGKRASGQPAPER